MRGISMIGNLGLSKETIKQVSFQIKDALPEWAYWEFIKDVNLANIKEFNLFLKGYCPNGINYLSTHSNSLKLYDHLLFLLLSRIPFLSLDAHKNNFIDYQLSNIIFLHIKKEQFNLALIRDTFKYKHKRLKIIFCIHDIINYRIDSDIEERLLLTNTHEYYMGKDELCSLDNAFLF